jgi:hypothetical protein
VWLLSAIVSSLTIHCLFAGFLTRDNNDKKTAGFDFSVLQTTATKEADINFRTQLKTATAD